MDVGRRIRRDARMLSSDPEAAALLECLAEHLFDPDLDTTLMGRVCSAPRPVRDRLAARIGPLKDYVTELRMTEAARLVRETDLPIREIGPRVGYRVARTFRRAFHLAHGVNPSDMRRPTRITMPDPTPRAPDSPAEEPAPLDDEHLTPRALAARIRRQASLGLLDSRRAAELRFKLRRHHPRLEEAIPPTEEIAPDPQQHPVLLTPTGDALEEIAADAVFRQWLTLPDADLRFALLEGVQLGNVHAFYRLRRACTGLIQEDPERALMLAELTVQLIEPHRQLMGDEADDWKAFAWAFLGRIQAHTGHDAGADQSLGFAAAEVGGEEGLKPWVEIEIRQVEGVLRKNQRRYDAAEHALDRAVELGRQLPSCHPDRWHTLLQRLELASALKDAETGFALARELEALVEICVEPDKVGDLWRGFVAYHRAKAHTVEGDDRRAAVSLRQAEQHVAIDLSAPDRSFRSAQELGILGAFVIHDLARIAARDDRLTDGESLLRTAVERYRRLEIPIFEAAAECELAVVCALRGQWTEARHLAATTAVFLDGLPFHREAWNVARELRELATPGSEAAAGDLEDFLTRIQHDLDLVAWEIAGSRAAPATRAKSAWT